MRTVWRHVRDISGMGVASVLATCVDWLAFFGMLRLMAAHVSLAAALASVAGGILHFSLLRSFVFSRFGRSVLSSAPRYVLVSGIALVLHTIGTTGLGHYVGADTAWLVSKICVFMLWCYPASRSLVFASRVRASAPARVDLDDESLAQPS